MEPTDTPATDINSAAPAAPASGLAENLKVRICRDFYRSKLMEFPPVLIAFGNTSEANAAGLPTLGTISGWASSLKDARVEHYGFGCFSIRIRGDEKVSFEGGGAMRNTDPSGGSDGISYTQLGFKDLSFIDSWSQFLASAAPGHVDLALQAAHFQRKAEIAKLLTEIDKEGARFSDVRRRCMTEHRAGDEGVVRVGPGVYRAWCRCGEEFRGKNRKQAAGMLAKHLLWASNDHTQARREFDAISARITNLNLEVSRLRSPYDRLLPK